MAKHRTNQTAQSIIQAALECLERDGLEGMTIRSIALQAGVNIAAVNYHFGSKEVLFGEVLNLASSNAFLDIDDWISATSGEALARELEQFGQHFVQGLQHYPNTSKVVLHELLFGNNSELRRRFEGFLEQLEQHLSNLHPEEGAWRCTQFVGVLISLCLMPEALEDGLKTTRAEVQARMLTLLV